MQHKRRAPAYLLSSYQHNSEGAPVMQTEGLQNTNADMRWQWPHLGLYRRCFILKCLDLEPALCSMLMHPKLRVPTRGSDFLDANVARRGTRLQDAVFQNVRHSLLWELWQDLQFIGWYVKLRPVVGDHALAVVSRREKRIFENQRLQQYRNRVNTSTWFYSKCFFPICLLLKSMKILTPEGSYHRFGVVFGQEWVFLEGIPQLCRDKAHFCQFNLVILASVQMKMETVF